MQRAAAVLEAMQVLAALRSPEGALAAGQPIPTPLRKTAWAGGRPRDTSEGCAHTRAGVLQGAQSRTTADQRSSCVALAPAFRLLVRQGSHRGQSLANGAARPEGPQSHAAPQGWRASRSWTVCARHGAAGQSTCSQQASGKVLAPSCVSEQTGRPCAVRRSARAGALSPQRPWCLLLRRF